MASSVHSQARCRPRCVESAAVDAAKVSAATAKCYGPFIACRIVVKRKLLGFLYNTQDR